MIAPVERDAIEAALREALASEPGVRSAWLYGSVARGDATARSDVDVAILTGRPRPRRLEDLPLDLEARLAARVGRPVQVIAVDHADADLVHRVLRDGTLLIDRDPGARVRFEVAARNRYFDMLPVWATVRRARRAT